MMEPHMIENFILIVFVIVVNHAGFIEIKIQLICKYRNHKQLFAFNK